jgi:uncharacterized Zn finger protein
MTPHPTSRLCTKCHSPTSITDRHAYPTGRVELTVECVECGYVETDTIQGEAPGKPANVRGL